MKVVYRSVHVLQFEVESRFGVALVVVPNCSHWICSDMIYQLVQIIERLLSELQLLRVSGFYLLLLIAELDKCRKDEFNWCIKENDQIMGLQRTALLVRVLLA